MSCSNVAHRSCAHRSRIRWRWQTDDSCSGTFCHECLLAVGIAWDDMKLFHRVIDETPCAVPQLTEPSNLAWMD